MGFINKEDGQFSSHQFNWPITVSTETVKKKAFHVETKDEKARIDYNQQSLQIKGGQYLSNETDRSVIRGSNVRKTAPISRDPIVKRRYENLKFCEANMIMTLNSYELDLFNVENPPISDSVEQTQISEENLTALYNTSINTYNLKPFDPGKQTYTDGNGQEYTTTINTIEQSKTPKNYLTLEEFKNQYRLSGRKAYLTKLLKSRGISNG